MKLNRRTIDLIIYRELRADGFAASAAIFYARRAYRGRCGQ